MYPLYKIRVYLALISERSIDHLLISLLPIIFSHLAVCDNNAVSQLDYTCALLNKGLQSNRYLIRVFGVAYFLMSFAHK